MTGTFKKVRALLACLVVGIAVVFSQAAAQGEAPNCGGYEDTIIFGEQDWDSAQVNNAIARFVLEEGFGCATEIIPGSTIPMQQGLIRDDIDVLTEIWMDNPPEFLPEALAEGEVVDMGIIFDDGQQGFFVPRYLIEGDAERGIEPLAPDLVSVADIAKYKDLFQDPEQPDKGRFFNCIIGWVCEGINNAKLEAYGLADDFVSFLPGTGVALASSMESAYLQGEPWFGYYWGPTWVLGKLDMVMLEEPEYTEACWDHLMANLEDPEQACAYPASVVRKGLSDKFADSASEEILAFLEGFEMSNDLVSKTLAYMEDNGALPGEAARHFLETNVDLWTQWVQPEVAQRVEAALQ